MDGTAPQPTDRIDRRGWLALLSIALGVSVVIMDATVVNVALPVVIEDLGLTTTDAQWINASYSLVFAALLLTLGRWGDLHGRRRLFGAGMVLFMAASLVAGSSQDAAVLVGARLVQGLGAAMIVPSTLSTINAMFVGRARTIAFAVWGSAIGGMAAIGPLVGGWLATDVSWRWAFWLNIPLGVVVLLGVALAIPETRDPAAVPGRDPMGVLLSALGMGSIVFGLIEAQTYGWWRQDDGTVSPVPFAVAAGVLLMVAFVFVEHRRAERGRHVLVDLGLFRLVTFRAGVVAALIVAFGEFGLLFTLPLLLQGTLGYTALQTGGILAALALGTFVVSGMLPQISKRLSQRSVVQTGLALEALAVGGLGLVLSMTISTWVLCVFLFVYGVGVGMATAQLTSLILSDVPRDESGQASGVQSSIRQLGSALGVALLGGLLISRLGAATRDNLTALGLPARAVDGVTSAVTDSAGIAIAGLQAHPATQSVAQAASDAMVHASQVTLWLAAAALLVGLLATVALPRTAAGADDPVPDAAEAP
ncbi:MFS transporter [Nocardioides sp.]|uniref:MFS transporter n=1 Tax=Nocardioides sp. TaxID=35761 RepID=UPI003782FAB4